MARWRWWRRRRGGAGAALRVCVAAAGLLLFACATSPPEERAEPGPAAAVLQGHYSAYGCPNKMPLRKVPSTCVPTEMTDELTAVTNATKGLVLVARCCSQGGDAFCISHEPGAGKAKQWRSCSGQTTYSGAKEHCASLKHEGRPMRLCTRVELEDNLCCGRGCAYDREMVWTSDPCEITVGDAAPLYTSMDQETAFRIHYPYTAKAHFTHVPKCGGTALSSALRRFMCVRNGVDEEMDCCHPGSCDNRRSPCRAILGCTDHVPRTQHLDEPMSIGSFTMLRHPVSRVVSAFFYRCHSPSSDCFGLNKNFCKQGTPVKKCQSEFGFVPVSFDAYVHNYTEYANVFTRMFGQNNFAYGYDPITAEDARKAKEVLARYAFVGLQEAYDASVLAIAHLIGVEPKLEDFSKVREAHGRTQPAKAVVKGRLREPGSSLHAAVLRANALDVDVYKHAISLFCSRLRAILRDVGDAFWMPDLAPAARSQFEAHCEGGGRQGPG